MEDGKDDLDLDVEGGRGGRRWSVKGAGIAVTLVFAGAGALAFVPFVGGPSGGEEAREAAAAVAEPVYVSVEPPLAVSFEGRRGRLLQMGIDILAPDPSVAEALRLDMPAIRHELILVFSDSNARWLSTGAGKTWAAGQAAAAVNRVLEARGLPGRVEELHFSNFVIE